MIPSVADATKDALNHEAREDFDLTFA